jgi:hypothetical protein
MPNPKIGTVTMDVKAAVEAAKGGQVTFRVEKAGIIHAGVGKVSFDQDKLVENIRAIVEAVTRAKPTGAKGTYLKKVSLSSTMGPGVTVDVGGWVLEGMQRGIVHGSRTQPFSIASLHVQSRRQNRTDRTDRACICREWQQPRMAVSRESRARASRC